MHWRSGKVFVTLGRMQLVVIKIVFFNLYIPYHRPNDEKLFSQEFETDRDFFNTEYSLKFI